RLDQPQDVGGGSEAARARLPRLDALSAREIEAPDDARLGREPRDLHAEMLEVAVERVVLVRDAMLRLSAEPGLDRQRRAAVEAPHTRGGERALRRIGDVRPPVLVHEG